MKNITKSSSNQSMLNFKKKDSYQSNTTNKRFFCSCGSTFVRNYGLKRHNYRFHKKILVAECCNNTFYCSENFAKHLKKKHTTKTLAGIAKNI